MSEEHIPFVSIGLAVYNGERFIREAIDSILAQTFTDFELIISDNASTDQTEAICREYAEKDARIRYSRNPTNIGGANNENLTFRLARGKYFRWAAHDDICAPELIEKCIAVLENDPSIVLCHTQEIKIDENGNSTGIVSSKLGQANTSWQRFAEVSSRGHACEQSYGVIRSDVLRSTRLQLNYTDSDRTLLAELSLHGKFFEVPELFFFKRFHPGNLYIDWRTRMAWFSDQFIGKIVFPNWLQYFDFYTSISRVRLPLKDKIMCYLYLIGPITFRHFRYLVKDVLVMFYMLLHSKEWRIQRYKATKTW
jgi:glycosyltransferase involved in cell wall biosynthesis